MSRVWGSTEMGTMLACVISKRKDSTGRLANATESEIRVAGFPLEHTDKVI